MRLKSIIRRQMRYWHELMKNTSLKNTMNVALKDIHRDGFKQQQRNKQKIILQNQQADKRIRHIKYLMDMLEPPIIIYYPNGSKKLVFLHQIQLSKHGQKKD